ncbi:MAG: ADP-ribosylglycohydrolase family protein, partial [Eisenbergiella sp.]
MSQDRPMLIKKAMEYIPETSRIYHVISDVSGAFEKGAELEKVMDYLETEYGDVDCSISFYNIGVIVLALLYGNGEFEKTITLAVNCGYDTDCTAATLGAVLGIIYGEEIFGKKWLGYCGEEIITGCVNLHYDILTIDKLSRITCNFGIETDLQECGKEQADSFTMDYVG